MEEIKNAFEAKEIENELKQDKLYPVFLNIWSFYWFEFIHKNISCEWNFDKLITNYNLSYEVIKYYSCINWKFDKICLNPHITYENVYEINNKMIFRRYINVNKFCANPNFTIDLIERNPYQLPIDFFYLSSNINIDENYFLENKNKNWDFSLLSFHPFVKWDFVRNHPEIQWDYENLSFNPNITFDIIKNNPDKPWDMENFTRNINMNIEIFKENKNLKKASILYIF